MELIADHFHGAKTRAKPHQGVQVVVGSQRKRHDVTSNDVTSNDVTSNDGTRSLEIASGTTGNDGERRLITRPINRTVGDLNDLSYGRQVLCQYEVAKQSDTLNSSSEVIRVSIQI